MHGMLTIGPENVQKLTEVYERFCGHTEIWRKVPRPHVKFTRFTEILVDGRKVDGLFHGRTKT